MARHFRNQVGAGLRSRNLRASGSKALEGVTGEFKLFGFLYRKIFLSVGAVLFSCVTYRDIHRYTFSPGTLLNGL
jgi:hypothetical protein